MKSFLQSMGVCAPLRATAPYVNLKKCGAGVLPLYGKCKQGGTDCKWRDKNLALNSATLEQTCDRTVPH